MERDGGGGQTRSIRHTCYIGVGAVSTAVFLGMHFEDCSFYLSLVAKCSTTCHPATMSLQSTGEVKKKQKHSTRLALHTHIGANKRSFIPLPVGSLFTKTVLGSQPFRHSPHHSHVRAREYRPARVYLPTDATSADPYLDKYLVFLEQNLTFQSRDSGTCGSITRIVRRPRKILERQI